MPSTLLRHLVPFVLAAGAIAAPLGASQPAPATPARDLRPLGGAPEKTGALAPDGRSATASEKPRALSTGAGTVRTAASLAGVLGVIFVGAALFKRFAAKHQTLAASLGSGGRSPAGIIEIVGRYPVGRGNSLVLLRLDNRILLLSQSVGPAGRGIIRTGAASLSTLCEITGAGEVASILAKARDASGDSMTARFQSLLNGFASQSEEPAPDAAAPSHSADHADTPTVVVRTGSWSPARGGAA